MAALMDEDVTVSPAVDVVAIPPDLAAAIVDAYGKLTDPRRGRTANVGTYSYRYVDLADVLRDVRPVLAAAGLAHVPLVDTEQSGNTATVRARTLLVHSSGQALVAGSVSLTVMSPDPQRIGSAITYARRYSTMAALSLAADDDDGAAASKQPAGKPEPTYRSPYEAEIRDLLAAEPKPVATAIRKAFTEQWGAPLSKLDPDLHMAALAFVQDQIAAAHQQVAEALADA